MTLRLTCSLPPPHMVGLCLPPSLSSSSLLSYYCLYAEYMFSSSFTNCCQ